MTKQEAINAMITSLASNSGVLSREAYAVILTFVVAIKSHAPLLSVYGQFNRERDRNVETFRGLAHWAAATAEYDRHHNG